MIAAARGYHRREDKPYWWAHFDRLNNPVDEWGDARRRVRRRRRPRSSRTGTCPARARQATAAGCGSTGAMAAGELTTRRCTRSTTRRRRPGLTDDPNGAACGSVERRSACDDPTRPTEVMVMRARTARTAAFHTVAVRADPGTADPHEGAAGGDRRRRGREVARRAARTARQRGRRHPAAPPAAHPQRRAAAAYRRRRRGHHRRTAGPGLVVSGGARPARHRQDLHRGAGHRPPGQRTSAGASASSRSHTPSWRTCSAMSSTPGWIQRWWPRRQNDADADRGRRSTRTPTPRSSPTNDGLRDRRHRMGFRQRRAGCRRQPRPAGHRGGRPVLPGQHHRGGAARHEPAAARRSATAASGQPGHPPRTGGRLRAGLAGRRTRTRCPPSSATSWTARTACTRRCARRCRGCPTTAGCTPTRAVTAARRLDGYRPGVRVLTVDHDGNSTDSPEEAEAIVAEIERLLGTRLDRRGRHPAAGAGRRAGGHAVQRPGGAVARASRRRRAARGRAPAPSTSSRGSRRRWCSCR